MTVYRAKAAEQSLCQILYTDSWQLSILVLSLWQVKRVVKTMKGERGSFFYDVSWMGRCKLLSNWKMYWRPSRIAKRFYTYQANIDTSFLFQYHNICLRWYKNEKIFLVYVASRTERFETILFWCNCHDIIVYFFLSMQFFLLRLIFRKGHKRFICTSRLIWCSNTQWSK